VVRWRQSRCPDTHHSMSRTFLFLSVLPPGHLAARGKIRACRCQTFGFSLGSTGRSSGGSRKRRLEATMTVSLKGGCACKNIRYECAEEPIVQLICHCRDCQRASGSAFAPLMFFAADTFRFSKGTPIFHEVVGGSGRLIQRGFCGKCGSPISAHWPEVPHVQIVVPVSLDDPSAFQPTTEIWLSRAQAWHPVHPGTTKFDGRPLSGVTDKLREYFAKRASSGGAMS
jgi:hypothetical protein